MPIEESAKLKAQCLQLALSFGPGAPEELIKIAEKLWAFMADSEEKKKTAIR